MSIFSSEAKLDDSQIGTEHSIIQIRSLSSSMKLHDWLAAMYLITISDYPVYCETGNFNQKKSIKQVSNIRNNS